MRPIGSEKLPIDQKVKRIMELANYSRDTESRNNSNIEYHIKVTDKKVYGIVRENSTYIIKEGSDVNSLNYIDGINNSNSDRFKSYGAALKRLNLMISESNKISGLQKGLSLYGEQEEKFVLKTPEAEETTDDLDFSMEDESGEEGGEDMDFDMEVSGEEEGEDGEEMDFDMEVSGEEEGGGPLPIKTIQKLTGKLGQKLREVEEDIDSDTIKYVLNSIISAVDITKLSAEDIEDIQDKLETEDDVDYTEEGEFDVEVDGDEEMGGEDEFNFEGDEEELDLEEGEGYIKPASEKELEIKEFWPAFKATAGVAAGAWAGKKMFGEDEEMENFGDDFPGEEEDEELKSKFMDIFSESNGTKVENTIKKYFKETKEEKNRKRVVAEGHLKEKTQRIKNNKLTGKYFVSYEQEVGTNKLMENYDVKFLGRTNKGDLLFKKGNVKIGVTPQGRIIS